MSYTRHVFIPFYVHSKVLQGASLSNMLWAAFIARLFSNLCTYIFTTPHSALVRVSQGFYEVVCSSVRSCWRQPVVNISPVWYIMLMDRFWYTSDYFSWRCEGHRLDRNRLLWGSYIIQLLYTHAFLTYSLTYSFSHLPVLFSFNLTSTWRPIFQFLHKNMKKI